MTMTRQEELEFMQDGDLNLLLATFVDQSVSNTWKSTDGTIWSEDNGMINYCQWSESVMPLAFDRKINFESLTNSEKYLISDSNSDFICKHKNPLRAAVIVLILIKESQGD